MKYKIGILFFVVATLSATLIPFHHASAAPFVANNIIDDSVFDDTTTMNAAQIDAFLNNFPNSCISSNSGFRAIDPTGYSPTNGFTYGGYVTAGQVINDAAQAYGLNPQVLITTLQKEQSLPQGSTNFCSNGDENKYAAAVGYGCPDSGTSYSYTGLNLYQRNGTTVGSVSPTCVNTATKAGFSQQVIRAAWLLKFGEQRAEGNINWAVIKGNWDNSDDPQSCYGGPMTQGTYQRCPSGATAYYDGYTTIDGTSVHMDNGATAALYWYTPHFSGNQNFATIFDNWFGSRIGSDLVRTVSNPTVYLVSGTTKYPIADGNVLNDFSPLGAVKYVSDTYINNYTTGAVLGHMVGDANGTLYFVNAGIRLPFSSCTSVVDYGYSCSSVITLTNLQINKLSAGPAATSLYATTSGKTFYIVGGQKREAFDQQSLTQAGISGAANTLLEGGIAYLPYGSPVVRDGIIVADRANGQQYIYDASKFMSIPSDLLGLSSIKSLGHGSLDDTSIPQNQIVGNFNGYMTDSTNKYLLLADGKAILSSPTTWSSSFTIISNTLSSALSASAAPINNGIVKDSDSSTVYDVVSGQKRPIPSWNDLVNLHTSPFVINNVSSSELGAIPSGPLMYAAGRLVKSSSSATVYVVKSPTELFPISSFLFSQELGVTSNILTINSPDLSTYTVLSPLQSKIVCQDGKNYVGINGKLFEVTPTLMTTYGFSQADFINVAGMCANLPNSAKSLVSFIHVSNGTIYYVSNGQKQPIVGYSTYLAHGGNSSNTMDVSDYFASLVTTGPAITQ